MSPKLRKRTKLINGEEQDTHSRWRHLVNVDTVAAKRSVNKRERYEGRQECRGARESYDTKTRSWMYDDWVSDERELETELYRESDWF